MATPEPMVSGSPDTITTGDSAHIQINRFRIPAPRDRWLAFMLAISIAVNVWCAFQIRDNSVEKRLQQYNMDWFRSHEFAQLEERVDVLHDEYLRKCER